MRIGIDAARLALALARATPDQTAEWRGRLPAGSNERSA
jgi:hypothetical protein